MTGRGWANTLLGVSMALAALACREGGAPSVSSLTLEEHHLRHGDLERTYWLAAASTDRLPSRAPLVLALHGGGGTALGQCRMRGGLLELAEEGEFILVCPQGIERHWNDGRPITRWRPHAEGIDDVGFLAAVVEDVSRQIPIDGQMVFATGISNGGQMSFRLACERADLVRAVAPVAASMAETLVCDPARPVSILILNGTDDPLVPYEGGEIGFGRGALGRVLPTESAFQLWAGLNGCTDPPAEESLGDHSPSDGTRIWKVSQTVCADESRVELYRIEGGGHTWPRGPQYLPVSLIGRVSQEIEGSQVIWDFFKSQAVAADP